MLRLTLLLLLLPLLTAPALGQTVSATTGAINGTVTDTTKGVLSGVTVTLSGPAVMGTPTTVTDQSGFFRFQALAPGDFTLTFDLAGFGRVAREGIHVSLGFTATVTVEMSPAGSSPCCSGGAAAPGAAASACLIPCCLAGLVWSRPGGAPCTSSSHWR
jgi:hypothetical protein